MQVVPTLTNVVSKSPKPVLNRVCDQSAIRQRLASIVDQQFTVGNPDKPSTWELV